MSTKPMKFQLRGVRRMERFGGRSLLADEMGLGKTFQTLLFKKRNKCRPTIVICPAFLKYNWEHEAKHHFGMSTFVAEGRKPPKRSQFLKEYTKNQYKFVIINYEILGGDGRSSKRKKKGKKKKTEPYTWVDFLLSLKPDLIAIDEVHRIKNKSTQCYENVAALVQGGRKGTKRRDRTPAPRVIAISGTPLTNRPVELWPTLNLLWPRIFRRFSKFAKRYCAPRYTPWGWDYSGASHLDELHHILRKAGMVRRLKKAVLDELPDKTISTHKFRLAPAQRKEYDAAVKDFASWIHKISPSKARKAKRAMAIVKLGYLRRLIAEAKYQSVINWIDNFLEESSGKLIIFAWHKGPLYKLHEHYPNSTIITGKVTGRKRFARVQKFQHQKKIRIMFSNIVEGLNLTAASTSAFIELHWTPGWHSQASDRTHRIGQKENVSIYYLIAENTIEEKFCAMLNRKQRNISAVLDGEDSGGDFNIINQLLREVEKTGRKK